MMPAPVTTTQHVVYIVGPNGQLIPQQVANGPVPVAPNGQIIHAQQSPMGSPVAMSVGQAPMAAPGTTLVPAYPPSNNGGSFAGTYDDVSPPFGSKSSGQYANTPSQNPLAEYGGAAPIHSQSNYNQRPPGN
jgi:hypothetical protein